MPPTAVTVATNAKLLPAGAPAASLLAGALALRLQFVVVAVVVAPSVARCTSLAFVWPSLEAVAKLRRTSSAAVPPSKLPTAAARLAGAKTCSCPATALTSAQSTKVRRPALPPLDCRVVQPIALPLASRSGPLKVSSDPGVLVPPPPPRANLPLGQDAVAPLAWIVLTLATPVAPLGPVAPVCPAGP